MKRIITLLLCIAIAVVFVASCSEAEQPLTVYELLEVAERYLLEGNYEQALVEFMRVIEVEPREPRGYTGAADALIGLGRYDEARAILEQGLRVLPGNAELQGRLEDLHSPEVVAEPEPVLEPELEFEPEPELDLGFLSALSDLLETDGFEALEETLESGELQDLINQIETFPATQLEDCGTRGIGVHMYDGEYWIYIGEFSGQIRNGHGVWFPLQGELSDIGYRFEGEWRDDLPNGNGTIYAYSGKRAGSLVNGLWHGQITVTWTYYSYLTFFLEYVNGSIVVIGLSQSDGENRHDVYIFSDGSAVTISDYDLEKTHGVRPFAER